MAGRGKSAAPAPGPSTNAAGAPLLPPPLRHNYLAKYGADLADPYLLVKYAVRYKGRDEVIALRAYPLAAQNVAEILEGEALEVREADVTEEAPSSIRYAELPAFLAEAGARGIEKTLRDRLADKLAIAAFFDPASKERSAPGEERAAFAARLSAAGGGSAADKLRARLEKKKADLLAREQDLSGRKSEKWMAIGSAVLQNIGLLHRAQAHGERRLRGAHQESHREQRRGPGGGAARRGGRPSRQAAEVSVVDPSRFEEETLVPSRTAVKILRYDLLWVS